MVGCKQLVRGFDLGCNPLSRSYLQKVILINTLDLDTLTVDYEALTVDFTLKTGALSFEFVSSSTANAITASADTEEYRGKISYSQKVNFPLNFVNYNDVKTIDDLNGCKVIALLKKSNGDIHVFGINSGLKVEPITYNVDGSEITLNNAGTEFKPFLFYSGNSENWDNNTF